MIELQRARLGREGKQLAGMKGAKPADRARQAIIVKQLERRAVELEQPPAAPPPANRAEVAASRPAAAESLGAAKVEFQVDGDQARATLVRGAERVEVTAHVVPGVIDDAELHARGMTILVTFDAKHSSLDVVGFSDEGTDASMRDPDREVIASFEEPLREAAAGQLEVPAVDRLVRLVTLLGEYPESTSLRKLYMVPPGSKGTSICSSINNTGSSSFPIFIEGTHDCRGTDRFDDETTLWTFLSPVEAHGGPCGNNKDTAFSPHEMSWYGCANVDHPKKADYDYAIGGCPGRCGEGCGGEIPLAGTASWSTGCLDHDICKRIGHQANSPAVWCEDEWNIAAVDAYSLPFCSYTFRTPVRDGNDSGGLCDWSHNGTWDGCDVNCDFIDPDCYRNPIAGDGFCQDANHMGSETCSTASSDCICGGVTYCAGAGVTGADDLGCKASSCCPKGTMDAEGCFQGNAPEYTTGFVWNSSLYTTPAATNCTGLAGAAFDGANCLYMEIPDDQAPDTQATVSFVRRTWLYVTDAPSCSPGFHSISSFFFFGGHLCESIATAPPGTTPFVWGNAFYFTPLPTNDDPGTPNDERCPKGTWDGVNCYWGATPSGAQAFVTNAGKKLYYTAVDPSRCSSPLEPQVSDR